MSNQYQRHKVLPIEPVLSLIGERHGRTRLFYGKYVGFGSVRLQTFKEKGTACVNCGLQGKFFAIEATKGRDDWHLNLYAVRPDGTEVLMTRDHIKPKSLGGSNGLTNSQPMCSPCNGKKGNTYGAR